MSAPQTANAIQVPIPIGGMNWLDPSSSLEPIYSPWLLNVEVETRYLRYRDRYGEFIDMASIVNNEGVYALGTHGAKLFAYVADTTLGFNKIYDISDGSATGSHDFASAVATQAYSFHFGGALYFVTNGTTHSDTDAYYNGSWNAWGFTYSSSDIGGIVACGHKGRLYVFNNTAFIGYYGALGALTGATTRWDISALFHDPGPAFDTGGLLDYKVAFARTVPSVGDRNEEQLLLVGSFSGEILLFAGDYPDAPNWQLIERFKIPQPISYNCVEEVNNDLIILTRAGVYSVKKIRQSGSDLSGQISISEKINPYWNTHVNNYITTNTYIQDARATPVFYPDKNKLYIMMQGLTYEDSSFDDYGATVFVYNAYTGAWAIHQLDVNTVALTGPAVYWEGTLYFPTNETVTEYGTTAFNNDEINNVSDTAEYSIKSAYMDFESRKKWKYIKAVEPIFKSDQTALQIVAITLSADFGRRTSASTGTVLPSVSGDVHLISYNVGIEGTFVQWAMSGSSSAGGDPVMELYAMGVVVI